MYYVNSLLQHIHPPIKPSGFTALGVNYTISQFVWGMLSLFGVLYIYELGVGFLPGIALICFYFLTQRVVIATSTFFAVKFISKHGYRWAMLVGLALLIVRLIFLMLSSSVNLYPLVLAAIAGGLSISFYFLSFNALFLDENDENRIGEQMGVLELLGRGAHVVSPFVAGIITKYLGFTSLFVISGAIIIISLLPLFLMEHHKRKPQAALLVNIKKYIVENMQINKAVLFLSATIAIQTFFWPVYVYEVVKDYEVFGNVSSLVMVFNAVAVYFAGKFYDKSKHRKVFVLSSIVVSLTWIMRFTSQTISSVIFSDSLNRVFSPPFWMRVQRSEFLRGEKFDSLIFAASHELVHTSGMMLGTLTGGLLLIAGFGWISLAAFTVVATSISTDKAYGE